MVESYVKMNRTDYLKVCEMLEKINSDISMYENDTNKDLIQATRNKVHIAQFLLTEENEIRFS